MRTVGLRTPATSSICVVWLLGNTQPTTCSYNPGACGNTCDFRPEDTHTVLGECEEYFGRHGWPNIPTEIELTRTDGSLMSAWEWEGLDYVVKFNFMYLTEVCTEPGEKEEIHAHLRGLWQHLRSVGVPFKAHWGKVNFIDPDFVRENHDLDAFRPLISPMFMNDYLAERLGPVG